MPKILVTRRTFSEAAEALRASGAEVVIWDGKDAPSHQDLIDAVADVDGLYAHITNQVNDEVMDAAPNLKVISEFGVGYDNIDVNAANERGIAVCNTPGILSESTADEAFALLASMARRTYDLPAMVKRGEWGDFDPLGLLASDIHHKTLGIVGMGNIGSEMAKRAAGFNMNVLYYNRNRRDEEFGATYVDSLEEILERSDFVSLHNPLTPETTNMMSIDQFKLMKKSAILINTTRGPVVDQDALVPLAVSVRILDTEDFLLLYGEILPISFAVPVTVGWRVGPDAGEWFGAHRLLVEREPVLQTTDRHVVLYPGPVVSEVEAGNFPATNPCGVGPAFVVEAYADGAGHDRVFRPEGQLQVARLLGRRFGPGELLGDGDARQLEGV